MFHCCGSSTFGEPPYSDNDKDYAKHIYLGSQSMTAAVSRTGSFDWAKANDFLEKHLDPKKSDLVFTALGISADNHNQSLLRQTILSLLKDFFLNGAADSSQEPNDLYKALLLDSEFKIEQSIDPGDFGYLDEVGRISPITAEPLLTPKNKTGRNYVIIRIYPADLSQQEQNVFNAYGHKPENLDDPSNKIAVSPSVAFRYRENRDVNTYLQLLHEKEEAEKVKDLQEKLSGIDLGPALEDLLGKLINLPNEDNLVPLSYEALEIDQKIPRSETVTYSWVESMVLKYYNFIDSSLQSREEQTQGKATIFTENIKAMSKTLVDAGLTAPKVIDKMADEINSRAEGDKVNHALCMLVVAYFVQHCEVLTK
jgi:hypothetical protein